MALYQSECPNCHLLSYRAKDVPQLTCSRCKHSFIPMSTLVEELAVTLSGGGHRASLFGIGVLLALVDLGLNQRVTYISSVSGGSITNAFVALKCRFEEEMPDSFDEIARQLVSTIVNRGALTPKWLALVFGVILFPIIGVVVAHQMGNPAATTLSIFVVCTIFLTVALLRGLVVEFLLTRRFFRASRHGACFKHMKAKEVEHIFCCTEVASGRPFYFDSAKEGQLYFRLEDSDFKDMFSKQHLIKNCPDLPIATAVRASAGFPGIPPRLLLLRDFPMAPESDGKTRPHTDRVFLSDGGIWNNFGTQSLLEDEIYKGSNQARRKPEIILIANASAAFGTVRAWQFHVPLWAEFKMMLRAVGILSVNTVEPRRVTFRQMLMQRLSHDLQGDSAQPLAVLIDIDKKVGDTERDFRQAFGSRDIFALRSHDYREWIKSLAHNLEEWLKGLPTGHVKPNSPELLDLVRHEFRYKPRLPVYPSVEVDHLVAKYIYSLEKVIDSKLGTLRTTLGKFRSSDAMSLLGRGYANTHVVAYCLGLTDSTDIKMTEERLHKLTEIPTANTLANRQVQ